MAWWGKVVGGALGFAVGGPIGAALGVAFGHGVDSFRGSPTERADVDEVDESDEPTDAERAQLAFFVAIFSVLGHMAKADGRVTREEIALANQVMDELDLEAGQRQLARELFAAGKEPDFDINEVLAQFRRECHFSGHLTGMFVEALTHAAYLDGEQHGRERALLETICNQLNVSAQEFQRIEASVRAERVVEEEPEGLPAEDAYAVLGVAPDATDADVKRAYRRLMSRYHPDKLVAKGLPEEMMELAKRKTQECRVAYERVMAARA